MNNEYEILCEWQNIFTYTFPVIISKLKPFWCIRITEYEASSKLQLFSGANNYNCSMILFDIIDKIDKQNGLT